LTLLCDLVGRQSGSTLMERHMWSLAFVEQQPWKLLIRRKSRTQNGLISMAENIKRHWRIGRSTSMESHSISDVSNLVVLPNLPN